MIPVIGVTVPFIVSVIAIVAGIGIFFIVVSFISVWVKAWSSGAPVSMMNLIFMRLFRKLPHSLIVEARITAVKAGIDLSIEQLETHYMAGGDIMQTTLALINAKKAALALDWNQATVIDLATKGNEIKPINLNERVRYFGFRLIRRGEWYLTDKENAKYLF